MCLCALTGEILIALVCQDFCVMCDIKSMKIVLFHLFHDSILFLNQTFLATGNSRNFPLCLYKRLLSSFVLRNQMLFYKLWFFINEISEKESLYVLLIREAQVKLLVKFSVPTISKHKEVF